MPLPRVQFTLRGLMIAVGVATVLLALARVPVGFMLALILVASALLAGACWELVRGRRRRAAWYFGVSAAAGNGLVTLNCTYLPNLLGFILMFFVSLFAIPAMISFGAALAIAVTNRDANPRRSPYVAWPLVLALAFAPLTMLTLWPLRLAFLVSQPALSRLADRVAAGQTLRRPEWAGLYRIVGTAVEPSTGNVGLIIDASPGGRSGFMRLGPGTPPERNIGPFFYFGSGVRQGDRWWYQEED
jgi:hypothetical protein